MAYCMSHFCRQFIKPYCSKISVRCVSHLARQAEKSEPHIYKKKYTVDEVIQYLTDNTVHDSDKFLVSCIPQGVCFFRENEWHDFDKPPVFDIGLQNIIPQLCEAFNSNEIFISKHPRRTSSGLIILSKNFKTFQTIRYNCKQARFRKDRIFCYLIIVLGSPVQSVLKAFRGVKKVVDNKSFIEILDLDNKEKSTVFKYKHEVIESTEHVSLIKVTVSDDRRDFVRHTLTQKMFTPILGDLWSTKKLENTLFGAPLVCNPSEMPTTPYKLSADILNKLKLKEGEENIVPICSHFYSIRLSLKSRTEFFVAVPPTESFVWTCNQLGLKKIEQFLNS